MKLITTVFVTASLCLFTAVLSITSIANAQTAPGLAGPPSREEVEAGARLSSRIGPEAAAGYVARFGKFAEDSYEVESSLKRLLERKHSEVDSERLAAAIDRIAAHDFKRDTVRDRKRLAKSWRLIYDVTKTMDGNTLEALEQLEIATLLDPDDESNARELEYQHRRASLIQARLDAAEAHRRGIVNEPEVIDPTMEGGRK